MSNYNASRLPTTYLLWITTTTTHLTTQHHLGSQHHPSPHHNTPLPFYIAHITTSQQFTLTSSQHTTPFLHHPHHHLTTVHSHLITTHHFLPTSPRSPPHNTLLSPASPHHNTPLPSYTTSLHSHLTHSIWYLTSLARLAVLECLVLHSARRTSTVLSSTHTIVDAAGVIYLSFSWVQVAFNICYTWRDNAIWHSRLSTMPLRWNCVKNIHLTYYKFSK